MTSTTSSVAAARTWTSQRRERRIALAHLRWEKLMVTGLPLASLYFLVQSVLLRNENSFVIVVPDGDGSGFVAIPQTAQQVKERFIDPVRAVGVPSGLRRSENH